jgi:hypothetical protein
MPARSAKPLLRLALVIAEFMTLKRHAFELLLSETSAQGSS